MNKRKTLIICFAIFVLVICTAFGARQLLHNLLAPDTPEKEESIAPLNILLLGSDARPHEKLGNTDTIIVAHITGDSLRLLSIPRDTRVEIPGYGMHKINAASRFGGPELTAQVVSDLIGVPIDNYALIRWEGFINIVDALGGIDINVPDPMHDDISERPEYQININEGLQHLNGQQALAFVRFRKEALGDIDRTGHQLDFMKALLEQARKPATILKLHVLVPQIYRNVNTNLGLRETLAIARAGNNLEQLDIVTQTLPGYFLNLNEISYWGVDIEQARQVARDLFEYGLTTKQIVLVTPEHLRTVPDRTVPNSPEPETEPSAQPIDNDNHPIPENSDDYDEPEPDEDPYEIDLPLPDNEEGTNSPTGENGENTNQGDSSLNNLLTTIM